MSSAPSTPKQRKLAKLERKVIRLALIRYVAWEKEWGKPHPWGHPQCARPKSGWDLIKATQALYEARRGK